MLSYPLNDSPSPTEERVVPIEVRRPKLSRYLKGIVFRCHQCTFTSGNASNLRTHALKHDNVRPYQCRLCYFDCTRLSELEAHLCDKHQVRLFGLMCPGAGVKKRGAWSGEYAGCDFSRLPLMFAQMNQVVTVQLLV